jgi:hypothetical protein
VVICVCCGAREKQAEEERSKANRGLLVDVV